VTESCRFRSIGYPCKIHPLVTLYVAEDSDIFLKITLMKNIKTIITAMSVVTGIFVMVSPIFM